MLEIVYKLREMAVEFSIPLLFSLLVILCCIAITWQRMHQERLMRWKLFYLKAHRELDKDRSAIKSRRDCVRLRFDLAILIKEAHEVMEHIEEDVNNPHWPKKNTAWLEKLHQLVETNPHLIKLYGPTLEAIRDRFKHLDRGGKAAVHIDIVDILFVLEQIRDDCKDLLIGA